MITQNQQVKQEEHYLIHFASFFIELTFLWRNHPISYEYMQIIYNHEHFTSQHISSYTQIYQKKKSHQILSVHFIFKLVRFSQDNMQYFTQNKLCYGRKQNKI